MKALFCGVGDAILTLGDSPEPEPSTHEILVDVKAVSFNAGELRRARDADERYIPGWDFAGVVAKPHEDANWPPVGTRVVGIRGGGAWAERISVSDLQIAPLPAAVSFSEAATLPVAGLSALRALRRCGELEGRRALVTGASGGVGMFAVQLAQFRGAEVTAVVRQTERVSFVRDLGADHVVVDPSGGIAGVEGRYDAVVESVGSQSLGSALEVLAPGGSCVTLGSSASSAVTFDARAFYTTGGVTLHGLFLHYDLAQQPPDLDLEYLAHLLASNSLTATPSVSAPWEQGPDIAKRYLNREIPGKVVLEVNAQ